MDGPTDLDSAVSTSSSTLPSPSLLLNQESPGIPGRALGRAPDSSPIVRSLLSQTSVAPVVSSSSVVRAPDSSPIVRSLLASRGSPPPLSRTVNPGLTTPVSSLEGHTDASQPPRQHNKRSVVLHGAGQFGIPPDSQAAPYHQRITNVPNETSSPIGRNSALTNSHAGHPGSTNISASSQANRGAGLTNGQAGHSHVFGTTSLPGSSQLGLHHQAIGNQVGLHNGHLGGQVGSAVNAMVQAANLAGMQYQTHPGAYPMTSPAGVGHGHLPTAASAASSPRVAAPRGAGQGAMYSALPPGVAVGVNDIQRDIMRMSEEGVQETVSEEVFSSYKSSISIPGAKIHPGNIVEASSLSDVPLPDATYDIAESIPSDMITSGKLSSLQLEGVLFACQRHQKIMSDGNRAGFFLGDAAGVGKGRQISAIILDNYVRGRTKHIWFSISSDLKVDAQRDVSDLGCHIKVIEGCQHLDKETRIFGLPSDVKRGVIFSTYATLVSSVTKGGGWNSKRRSRLDQLIKWCGGDTFDGCLIFDECHKAKHFVPGKENSSTKVAVAVTTIQRMLPKARVLYCSATGVTDVKDMAFMERLGLWGPGAPFKSFDHFIEAINRRGLGVAEMLAMEMKASGMYISRGLSFREAEFVTVEERLTPKQVKMYDVAAHVWNELRKALESAIERTNTSTSRVWSSFWGCHQRFFKQLCFGVKVPTIVKEARAALDEGYSVVIGLQTTGEASLESEMLKSDNKLTEFVSIAREILKRFINQHFPTKIIVSPNEPPREDEWCTQAKQLLLNFAVKIDLPNSPLDVIIDELGGTSAVAEMTGRRGRMVHASGPKSPIKYELRAADNNDVGIESLNVKERNSFMEGRKLVAIISDAASTGISLHADSRVANQKRRVHLTVELPWSADKAVQQLGRTHRSNQSSGPLYKLLTTNLGGERRFAAAVARRLQSLGALTQGDRRAASGADLTQFNFDTNYGRTALRSMYSAICNRQIVGGVELTKITHGKMDFAVFNDNMQECLSLMGVLETGLTHLKVAEKDAGNVSKFLNRILGVGVHKQNLIFNYFYECLQSTISTAKKEGKYNEGLVDITASSVEMMGQPKQVFMNAKTSTPTFHMSISVDRGMMWEKSLERLDSHRGTRDGYYKSKREQFGKPLYLLATQKPNSTHLFRIARPNTGISAFDEEISELLSRYNPVTKEEAEAGWKEQYEACKTKCFHGTHCKHPNTCTIGSRCYRMDILCGGIVTLMATLESTVASYAAKMDLSKASYSMKVVRVELTDGQRMIGIRYPSELVDVAEDILKQSKAIESLQAKMNIGPNGMPLLTRPVMEPISKASIDSTSPVNPKLLKQAMTAPKTIHNFFKAVSPQARIAQQLDHSPESSQVKGHKSKADEEDELMIISDSGTDSTPKLKPTETKTSGSKVKSRSSISKWATATKDPVTSKRTPKNAPDAAEESLTESSPSPPKSSSKKRSLKRSSADKAKSKKNRTTSKRTPKKADAAEESLTDASSPSPSKSSSKTRSLKRSSTDKAKSKKVRTTSKRTPKNPDVAEESLPDETSPSPPNSSSKRRSLKRSAADKAENKISEIAAEASTNESDSSDSSLSSQEESKSRSKKSRSAAKTARKSINVAALTHKCKGCKKSKSSCTCKTKGKETQDKTPNSSADEWLPPSQGKSQPKGAPEDDSMPASQSKSQSKRARRSSGKQTRTCRKAPPIATVCISSDDEFTTQDKTKSRAILSGASSDDDVPLARVTDVAKGVVTKGARHTKLSRRSKGSKSKAQNDSPKDDEIFTKDKNIRKASGNKAATDEKLSPRPMCSETQTAQGGRKRPLTNSWDDNVSVSKTIPLKENNPTLSSSNSKSTAIGQPAKKSKPGGIVSSLVEVKYQRQVMCPICQKDLPSGTTNEALNQHVDKCLQGMA